MSEDAHARPTPIFLISGLAEHTKNLERDPRASLLVAEGGSADPLANGRVTLLGPCTRVEGDGGSARAAFFAAHPNSSYRFSASFMRSGVLKACGATLIVATGIGADFHGTMGFSTGLASGSA
jgi:Pyridoxamine 5'-phosphate oxidase